MARDAAITRRVGRGARSVGVGAEILGASSAAGARNAKKRARSRVRLSLIKHLSSTAAERDWEPDNGLPSGFCPSKIDCGQVLFGSRIAEMRKGEFVVRKDAVGAPRKRPREGYNAYTS